MTTSEAALEIGPITFGPDRFKIDGRLFTYEQVKSVSWYWFSQTINVINTQNAKLSVFIRDTGEEIKLSKHTMYVSPKLAEAYKVLRERTWKYRIDDYVQEMAMRGCFTYQGAEFFTNGAIRQGEDLFSLGQATIQPFELSVKRDGFFSRKLSVSLTVDNDIVQTLLGQFRQSPEAPDSYVERMKTAQEEHDATRHWFFDTIRLCAKIANADGEVDPDEILIIKEFVRVSFKLDDGMLRRAITLFNDSRESHRPARFYAERLFKHHGRDSKLMGAILNLLRDVALADGHLHDTETALLADISRVFGFDPKRKTNEQHSEQKKSAEQQSRSHANLPEEKRHGQVLGLKGQVTVDVIRAAYRKLVMAHHPDKFHNESERERKQAHDRMVEINAAYSFFKQRYEF